MDELTSFLEHPLDKDLYYTKKRSHEVKPPLRVLITEAGSKIAYNILYSISSGSVFGPDQEVILHLVNSRGSRNHKAVILELQESAEWNKGVHDVFTIIDFVVSSNPAVVFKKVDVVIAISTYEEMPGRLVTGAIMYQMIKARHLVRNIQDYANENCKLILTGPSTKAITVLLASFSKFVTKMPLENISCVTHIDVVISKAMLAAKLKTTTDKIKNVVVWSATYPDVQNATVRMYPPGDLGAWEMKDVPVAEALQDDAWLYSTFALAIYRRSMTPDILTFGKAIAQSTVHHLKVLFQGSNAFDEMSSMAVISPQSKPYGLPSGIGLSFPVETENGVWRVQENVSTSVPTRLNIMRCLFNLSHGVILNSIIKVVSFMMDYEISQKQMYRFCPRAVVDQVLETRPWTTKYFVTPSPAEVVVKLRKDGRSSRKSILWGDEYQPVKYRTEIKKSSIRFSTDTSKDSNKNSYYSYENEEIISIFNKRGSSSASSGSKRNATKNV